LPSYIALSRILLWLESERVHYKLTHSLIACAPDFCQNSGF